MHTKAATSISSQASLSLQPTAVASFRSIGVSKNNKREVCMLSGKPESTYVVESFTQQTLS